MNWHVSLHEQQDSVSGEVSHCLCRSPSDNMTSLKFVGVLEIQGHITKNHLLRTCSVYLIFWSKNASCSCNGRVQLNGQAMGGHPKTQTMQTADCMQTANRADWVLLFLLYSCFCIYFWLAYFLVLFNHISECLLSTGRVALVVCGCWCVIDFARETPFSPKYA